MGLAVLRTNAGDAEPVDLQVRAFSSEPSTGLQAASSTQSLKWQPTPLLLADPQALLISPNGVQRSTETSSVSVALNWPKVARSGQLQIDLPLGSALTLDGFDVQSGELDGKQRFVVTLAADGEQSLPAELALKVSSPEIFRGLFEGSLELISSVRSELPSGGLSAEELATEQAAGLTRQRAPINFSWEVAQVAQSQNLVLTQSRFNPSPVRYRLICGEAAAVPDTATLQKLSRSRCATFQLDTTRQVRGRGVSGSRCHRCLRHHDPVHSAR